MSDTREAAPEAVSLGAAIRARKRAERAEVRRFTARGRKRRTFWLTVAGIAVTFLAIVSIVLFTPIMAVREVRVEGTNRLDAAEVQSAFSDIEGRPLALITSGDVAERLQPFVLVQSYAYRMEAPSTLVIEIVEREPVGSISQSGEYVVVDAAGVVLWRASEVPADVPVMDVGGSDITSPGFRAAAGVMYALPADLRAQVRVVSALTFDSVTLVLRDGTRVVWGSSEDSDRKAQVLAALIAATAGSSVSVYDVSSPETPVTR